MTVVSQPKWVGAILGILAILQAFGFTAARQASDTVKDVSATVQDVRRCVHDLGESTTGSDECNLEELTSQIEDTRGLVSGLPGMITSDLDRLRGLPPDQLRQLLGQIRSARPPAGPAGAPGPPGPAGAPPASTTTTGAPTTTTTTFRAPPGSPPGSTTTTTTRPRATTTTTRCTVALLRVGCR